MSKHLLSDLLALLNMPVAEIEKWLFATCSRSSAPRREQSAIS